MRKFTNIGEKRRWRTWFAIHANGGDHSPIFPPTTLLDSRRSRLAWSTAAFGNKVTSRNVERRLFSGTRSVGRDESRMAPVFRGEWNGLVGATVSARQHAASHRSHVRWLPLGRLQHSQQASGGVERRLQALPRSRKRARGASDARQYAESCAHGLRRRERHLYSMPFARASAH
jgi:hypothetical protein